MSGILPGSSIVSPLAGVWSCPNIRVNRNTPRPRSGSSFSSHPCSNRTDNPATHTSSPFTVNAFGGSGVPSRACSTNNSVVSTPVGVCRWSVTTISATRRSSVSRVTICCNSRFSSSSFWIRTAGDCGL
jgi:hypothetical protein